MDVGDVRTGPEHRFQAVRLRPEEVVLAGTVLRPHHEDVDIASWFMYAQAVLPEGKHEAALVLDGGGVEARRGRDPLDPVVDEDVELGEDLLALLNDLLRVEEVATREELTAWERR